MIPRVRQQQQANEQAEAGALLKNVLITNLNKRLLGPLELLTKKRRNSSFKYLKQKSVAKRQY